MAGVCTKSLATALDVLVGKWKPILLVLIYENHTLRYGELQRLVPGISKKVLTDQLRDLEYNNLIARKVYPQVPPKVEYSITDYGKKIMPLMSSMHEWGLNHLTHLEKIHGFNNKENE